MRSRQKYKLPVGTDDVSKDRISSAVRAGSLRDATVWPALDQVNRHDTETPGEEGIDSRQQGQKQSFEYLLRQYLSMQRALIDRMTYIERSVEKFIKAVRTMNLESSV